ncbi:MAG TPA: D-arabinono-1,4-lactone oxidase [Solirubrobacterales bacterium]|jgi:L-gulonolactone oxidase|nr:D-arabinono-1,4-lactone oxidase [Solirubrobacterales bacterium]
MPSEWRNWAGDQRCTPAAIERPGTRGELTDAIGRAAAQQRAVRAAASGHSFTDIACTAGVMLRLERLDRVLDVDRESGLVRVEAGIGLHDLAQALDTHGLALENQGDIDHQTLAGAISTATHGTGALFPNMSAQVESVELVLADGSVTELNADSDPDGVRAARAGLGALGMIYAVTLRTVPAFTIRRVDRPAPLQETLAGLDELPDLHDHFELYTFPHTDVAVLRQSERTDEPPRPRSRRREYVQEVVLENWVAEAYARVSRRLPSLTGPLARALAGRIGRSVKVDRSHRVFASERRLRFTEMEYAIPREHGAEAVRRVLELIEREDLRVSLPIEVRFVASDDAFLSPSHERETCYVAVHMYRGVAWERYFRGVEQIMDSYGGRPHWGKRHFQTAETLAPRYPRWADFQRVRSRLDPEGRFANAYTDRVLGPALSAARV